MLDLAITIATNGQLTSLQAALDQAIDCNALAAQAGTLAGQIVGPLGAGAAAAVLTICTNDKQALINAIIGGIDNIGLSQETLRFDQHGHAVDLRHDGRATVLQSIAVPDTIDGRFTLLVSSALSGRWEGQNTSP
jgi:hypothetical protein